MSYVKIRQAHHSEIRSVQSLDAMMLEDGFRHYEQLFALNPRGILVAVDNEKVVGFIAAERISQSKLASSLPPLDHDPEQFSEIGNVAYIVGHSVEPDYTIVGDKLISQFLKSAEDQKYAIAAVAHNFRHPTLRNPNDLWGRFGFGPISSTYDPDWKHAIDKPVDGCIVWLKYLDR